MKRSLLALDMPLFEETGIASTLRSGI